jgi:hypothetical protein
MPDEPPNKKEKKRDPDPNNSWDDNLLTTYLLLETDAGRYRSEEESVRFFWTGRAAECKDQSGRCYQDYQSQETLSLDQDGIELLTHLWEKTLRISTISVRCVMIYDLSGLVEEFTAVMSLSSFNRVVTPFAPLAQ